MIKNGPFFSLFFLAQKNLTAVSGTHRGVSVVGVRRRFATEGVTWALPWACNGNQSSNLTTGEVAKALRRPARAV